MNHHPVPVVTLKPGHVRPVWSGHPWVFAQAIARVQGGALPGDEVAVVDPQGGELGRGLYSPRSAIAVRIFTRDKTPVDAALLRARIDRAIALRRELGLPDATPSHRTDGYRLVHAEGDGLPGLVVDVFGDVLVVQLNTIGTKRREGAIFDALQNALTPRAIIDRTPESVARLEQCEVGSGVVRGDAHVDRLRFAERGIVYDLPMNLGQKTGYYFDQRPLRSRVEHLARGKHVLDAFCFVGSFALSAARGGAASVVAVDQSAIALEVASECARANGLLERIRFVRADARKVFEQSAPKGGFDLVVCDPPKFAPSKGAREGALGSYKRVATSACRATRPGGMVVLCSCSGAISLDDLTRALALGAREARMQPTILERMFQGADHPVPAAFPEGVYLKSVIARVDVL